MVGPVRAILSDLPKGHEFSPTTFELTAESVDRYLSAAHDRNTIYHERGLAPPLAVAAIALGSLLEVLELPAGTLHTGQELDVRAGVPIGATLALSGRIAQRSERAGLIIVVLEFEVAAAGSREPSLTGRTTVMSPGDGAR